MICASPANIMPRGLASGKEVDCSRCGDFSIPREIEDDYCPVTDLKQRAVASYLIRKSQGPNRFLLTRTFFESLPERALPSPAEMSDNLLRWAAESTDGRPGKRVNIAYDDPKIAGTIGAFDHNDVQWAVNALRSAALLDGSAGLSLHTGNVTAHGWRRIEEMKHAHTASNFAFFARQFNNPDLDTAYERCLRPAVAETGYELRTVTQRAGLVDAIIEDENSSLPIFDCRPVR